jgi:hypothetical protein
MLIYERNINSTVRKTDDRTIVVRASLLDLNHNMNVELTIDTKDRVVTKAVAEIVKAPVKICGRTLANLKAIEGLKIERGVNRQLVAALGGSGGCTHLYELALHSVRLAFNVIIGLGFNWGEWINRSIDDEAFVNLAMPHLKNSCLPFRSES